jgi:catechol 2,3-dioxygenase-like lactoylglutathione lyase family enzyme
MSIHVLGWDHLVLRCLDVGNTLRWYTDRLGLAPVRVEQWLAGEAPFPSVRVDATAIIDLLPARPGDLSGGPEGRLDHVCLVVDASSLDQVLADPSFEVIDGPGQRFGAQGVATSVYIRDPDGLVVELRCYPPSGPG